MERATTFANTWLILQTLGFIIALDGVAEYFSDRHYLTLFRRCIFLYYEARGGANTDPAQPRPPESWEEWYNS